MSAARLINSNKSSSSSSDEFNYFVEQFDDIRILKYRLPRFEELSLRQKEYIYYLSQAALAGRDIFWDQNFRYNLLIRKTIETIISSYDGDRLCDDFLSFMIYSKKVFFANGIHHHYSGDKFKPLFTPEYLFKLIDGSEKDKLIHNTGTTSGKLAELLTAVIFDENLYCRKVEKKDGIDIITSSSINFYEGVFQKEVEEFYTGKKVTDDPRPVAIGLNSKIIKHDGIVAEEIYRSGGKYGEVIDRITDWIEKAISVAETDLQKNELTILVQYYKTGDLKTWDEYNVAWAGNHDTIVDYINGFIEVYEDPLGMKGSWEAIVDYVDEEATKRTKIITANAQWFEDNSPVDPVFKKHKVTGVAAKVINIAMLGGASYPASPLGINLPNSSWIRKEVGSKSVTIANISDAYHAASRRNGFLEEFAADATEVERVEKYETASEALHTDLHECIGHASGKLSEGTDPNALKNYASAIEEARADLFALYYIMDKKILELQLLPNADAAMSCYDNFLRNGLLTQCVRIEPGKNIEEAHMRNRAAISNWVYDRGKAANVVEIFRKNGKTFVRINDYYKLKELFGELLREVQRIRSEGDFESGKKLIEEYGVRIDPQLHKEILDRYSKLNLAPYTGFVNPDLVPVYDSEGNISDVTVKYTDDYLDQMMKYCKEYSFLPLT